MRLTYIFHSGYAIEINGITMIFDYYKDSSDNKSDGVVYNKLLNNKGPIYVFSSHAHYDHFNKEILEWKNLKKNITYIFSSDILEDGLSSKDNAVYLKKSEVFKDNNIEVKAFGSTDKGSSFWIKTEGKDIFHAGDLNNWHWNEESTDGEIKEAENFYQKELSLVADNIKHLNLAMFPVDPRLGKDYMMGAEQFIAKIKTEYLAPMHFVKSYEKAAAFAPIAAKYGCKCICWTHRGESIEI